jgi:ABC-type Fe3+/spermidine/putrescine transport system ATPase subunit
MSDLRLENLSKTYAGADQPALHPLSLSVGAGEMLALLGPSGCGKSTALRLIAGLDVPSSGAVYIGAAPVTALPPEARSAVMVFQNHLLFAHMSVAQNVGFGLRMRGLGRTEIDQRVAQMLARVQLTAQAQAMPAMLSGGQAQRAALARALILRPRVLLLDEPLASLDPHLRGEMRALIAQVQAEMGITTILVTHDQAEAVQLAPRIALLMQGRLCQIGPARDFYDRPASLAAARFFGGVNFLPAHIAQGQVQCALGRFGARAGWAGQGHLTIRPESVQISPTPAPNVINARLTALRDLGEICRAVVVTDQGVSLEISLAHHAAQGLSLGQTLYATLPEGAIWFIAQGADE